MAKNSTPTNDPFKTIKVANAGKRSCGALKIERETGNRIVSCRKNPGEGKGNERKKMDDLGCCIGVVVFGWLRHRRRDQGEAVDRYRTRIQRLSSASTYRMIAIKEPGVDLG